MKLNTLMRPSMLPSAVCALPAVVPATAAERVWAPQVHQVLIQAELGEAALVLVGGNQGTTGFNTISSKRYTDGGSGVPPRGRPV